jgi:hypothetical protein
VEVGHVDGDESHSNPSNLFWTCRSCNVRCANTLRRAGIGRLTRQYSPASAGATTLGEWMQAVLSMKGEGGDMSVGDAIAMIHATSPVHRSRFAKEIWRRRRQHGTDRAVPFRPPGMAFVHQIHKTGGTGLSQGRRLCGHCGFPDCSQ